MIRIFRNKKAVSPVISTILMILVVMVGMSIAFSYIVVYANNYKAGAGSSVLESLTIENVWVQGTTAQVTVYNTATKANLGYDVNLQVTTIYVDGTALTNCEGSPTIGDPNYNPNYGNPKFDLKSNSNPLYNGQVNAGVHVAFKGLNPMGNLGPGTHVISVVTVRGSIFKSSFTVS